MEKGRVLFKFKKKVLLLILCLLTSSVLLGITPSTVSQEETATIFLDPAEVDVLVGNEFAVNLNVANVTDLYAWQARIHFDPTQMNCTGAELGPFLEEAGPTVHPSPVIDNEAGYVLVGDSLMFGEGVSGNGILAYIYFKCIGPGSSILQFNRSDTYLLNSALEQIPCVIVDGSVTQESRFRTLHSERPLMPVHMHNNESLVPIHMHNNVTLTPVHMHYIGDPEIDPIYYPMDTDWHELYPEYCQEWHLTSWKDNGDGLLSPSDQIDMINLLTEEVKWYHVDRITYTLILSNPEFPEVQMAIEFKWPPEVDPKYDPVNTSWHEVWPVYSNVYTIISWYDDGDGVLDFCDYIELDDGTTWHVEDLATDIILREKIAYPISTWWHEIYPEYSQWWHLTSWEDNGDGLLSPSDQIDMINLLTEEVKWYHVDRVTLTLNLTKEITGENILIEFKGSYEEMYEALSWPIETIWHEVYPTYSNIYFLSQWDWMEDDNCNGVLDVCDYIWLINVTTGVKERYHVDDICYDIILNEKIMDPRCTWWHELYPEYSQWWHLTSWEEPLEDPYPGRLSPGDQIDMTNEVTGEKKWYFVDRVTFTMLVSNVSNPEDIMYIEYKGPFEEIYNIKTVPWNSSWHEVWPIYSEIWKITDWGDNCNGVLDYCDYLSFDGGATWWHVEELAIDIILTEKISDPVCTYWHEIYPEYCQEWHITDWEDNGDGLLTPCDYIDMELQPDGPIEKYHVENATITLLVSNGTTTMYIELKIGDAPIEDALACLSNPWFTYWHEIYPVFCREYEFTDWNDNCNGVLDYCDWIYLVPTNYPGEAQWWHIEEVSYDIFVKKLVHDVAVTDVYSWYDWVYQGEIDPISVTIENQGDFVENPTVTAYYNGIPAAPAKAVNLNPGEVKTLTFYWDTTGVPPGSYTISATAVIPVDDDPFDNSKTGNIEEVRILPWYVKPSYPDYAPSGMPDFDQRQWGTYNWTDPWGAWSHCGPVSVANSLWWFDSEYEYLYNPSSPPPPAISDSFPLVQAYGSWDDHDPNNVPPLVEHLAWLMDCDGRRTGMQHSGTYINDMEAGLAQYLSWSGVNPLGDVNGDGIVNQTDVDIVEAAYGSMPGDPNWNLAADIYPATVTYPPTTDNVIDMNDVYLVTNHINETGLFYEHTAHAWEDPEFFWFIEKEVERCQDVVLLLGFYVPGTDIREGGHYVTVAGVNSTMMQLLISNPIRDDFEAGNTPGRSPVRHIHLPPEPPYTTHNNASLVSHDAYNVTYAPSPSGYHWLLEGYFPPDYLEARIEYAVITSPLGIHDVALTKIEPWRSIVTQNYACKINITIINKGNFTETVDVTLYANTTVIDTFTSIVLPSGHTLTITSTWNTTGFAKGNYTLSAYVWPVPGEVAVADNTFVDGYVCVVMAGDINADYVVNFKDAILLGAAFGSKPGDPNWNPNADINGDNIINFKDAILLGANFGKTDP